MDSTPKDVVFDVLVNRRSGTVLNVGEEQVRDDLQKSFGTQAGNIVFVEGGEIAEKVREWAAQHAGSGRSLVIGGGDGTVLSAASEILGHEDITLGVLPLGTHNLFARQLGFAADFKKAAEQCRSSHPEEIDVGMVNGMPFLIGMMIDRNSVNFFAMREDVRSSKKVSALKKAFGIAAGSLALPKETLEITQPDGATKTLSGRFLMVSNNGYAPRSSKGTFPIGTENFKTVAENVFAKEGLSGGFMTIYAYSGGLPDALRILPHLYNGTWVSHKTVESITGAEFSISPGDKDRKDATIVLDGEMKQVQFPLDVNIIPKGIRVYRP